MTHNLPGHCVVSIRGIRNNVLMPQMPLEHAAVRPLQGTAVDMAGLRQVFPGAVTVLDAFDLSVPAGQFLAILGPSGCGKSTLLRLIAGLDRPSGGSVRLDYPDPTPGDANGRERSDIAYVFQDAHLLPWRTVLDNVVLPLELQHADRTSRVGAAAEALSQVGLGDALGRYPAQLSGGMRMRVSLARALVTRPSLLLLDEPFAALDEITRQRLDEQLRELWSTLGMTVIFVTHSTTEAVFLAQRAIVMTRRPGRIIEDCNIDLPEQRHGTVRATESFALQTRLIYEALERGEA